jgi:hypothetical protein
MLFAAAAAGVGAAVSPPARRVAVNAPKARIRNVNRSRNAAVARLSETSEDGGDRGGLADDQEAPPVEDIGERSSTVSGAALYTKGRRGGKCIFGNACRPSSVVTAQHCRRACMRVARHKLPHDHVSLSDPICTCERPNKSFPACLPIASESKCLLPHMLPNEVALH